MLANLPSQETEQAIKALRSLGVWVAKLSQSEIAADEYHAAIAAIQDALLKTRKYLKYRHDGGARAEDKENELSDVWHAAATAIRPYDRELANLCQVKGHGWADERIWNKGENRKLSLSLDKMFDRAKNVTPPPTPTPKWFPIAGVIFAALTVISLFYLLIGPSTIEPGRKTIFDVWIALCVAASGSFLGGSAYAKGKLPIPNWLAGTPVQFMAGGGIAIFVIVFLLLSIAY